MGDLTVSAEMLLGMIFSTLLMILLLLLVVVRTLKQRSTPYEYISSKIIEQNRKILESTKHGAEVSAILKSLDEFKDNPSLVEKLDEYSEQVVMAALFYQINVLGKTIEDTTDTLHLQRTSSYYDEDDIKETAKSLKEYQEELSSLNATVKSRNKTRLNVTPLKRD